MLRWLKKRSETASRAKKLYGSVVAAARQPAFYGNIGVPDTPEGRFDLIALHLYLAIEGSTIIEPAADDLRRRSIEFFVEDMDDCMREMGVGDLTVPKKVKRAAAAFYERATSYHRDLTSEEEGSLAANIARTLLAEAANKYSASTALSHYVKKAASALAVERFDAWVESGASQQLLETSVSSIRMTTT
jgi:cytochrome b pre-mRNA-processing protein 3